GPRRRAVAHALLELLGDGLLHLRAPVAEDHRPPRADVVDVFLAVLADELRALGLADEDWRAADGLERTHGRVHAARDEPFGSLEELLGDSILGHVADASGKAGLRSRRSGGNVEAPRSLIGLEST